MTGPEISAEAIRRAVQQARLHGTYRVDNWPVSDRADYVPWERVRTGFGGLVYSRAKEPGSSRYQWSVQPERYAERGLR